MLEIAAASSLPPVSHSTPRPRLRKPRATGLAASLLGAALATGGCYGAAPPRPAPIALPPLADSTEITVTSESTTTIENVPKKMVSCPAGHIEGSPACVITRYTEAEPVTSTATTARYGDVQLDIAQFWVMTDPDYRNKLDRLASLSSACRGANVPRWIGMGLVLGGLVSWGIASGSNEAAFTYVGMGALATGGGAYAFGYYGYGGNRCKEAQILYQQIDYDNAIGAPIAYGPERASEMKVLADQFNATATRAAGAGATDDEPGAAAE
jgi:hypothetical protein